MKQMNRLSKIKQKIDKKLNINKKSHLKDQILDQKNKDDNCYPTSKRNSQDERGKLGFLMRYSGLLAIMSGGILIMVSIKLFPDFSWIGHALSEFGYYHSTKLLFNPGLIGISILLFLFILDLLSRFDLKIFSTMGILFGMANLSLIIVALFPTHLYDRIHLLAAYMALFFFTFALYFFGLRIRAKNHKKAAKFNFVLITFGLIPSIMAYRLFEGLAIAEVIYASTVWIWLIYFTFYDVKKKKISWSFG